ncbi:hypothetical protein A4G19_09425 [Pasteurellaceae bacterium Macca]|nr:hypothetical protein [Pasteurellaceae bacterium Macca]
MRNSHPIPNLQDKLKQEMDTLYSLGTMIECLASVVPDNEFVPLNEGSFNFALKRISLDLFNGLERIQDLMDSLSKGAKMRNSTQPQAEHLNEASKAFWQAYSLLQMTANGIQSNSDPHTIIQH